jgi:hypothetical protein
MLQHGILAIDRIWAARPQWSGARPPNLITVEKLDLAWSIALPSVAT